MEMLNIALPKGRLGEKVYELFQAAGYDCPALLEPNCVCQKENVAKGHEKGEQRQRRR